MEERLKLFNIDEEHLATEMQDRVSSVLPPALGKQRSGSFVGVKERQKATSPHFGKQRIHSPLLGLKERANLELPKTPRKTARKQMKIGLPAKMEGTQHGH